MRSGILKSLSTGGIISSIKQPISTSWNPIKAPVFLRPRRFGKSLWCSLLECYYDMNRREQFEQLFGNWPSDAIPRRNGIVIWCCASIFPKSNVEPDYRGLRRISTRNAAIVSAFSCPICRLFARRHVATDDDAAPRNAGTMFSREVRAGHSRRFISSSTNTITSPTNWSPLIRTRCTGKSLPAILPARLLQGHQGRHGRSFDRTGLHHRGAADHHRRSHQRLQHCPGGHAGTGALAMLGFTQAEVDDYLDTFFPSMGFDQKSNHKCALVKDFYNGYAFTAETTERLYNSTVITYFSKNSSL